MREMENKRIASGPRFHFVFLQNCFKSVVQKRKNLMGCFPFSDSEKKHWFCMEMLVNQNEIVFGTKVVKVPNQDILKFSKLQWFDPLKMV